MERVDVLNKIKEVVTRNLEGIDLPEIDEDVCIWDLTNGEEDDEAIAKDLIKEFQIEEYFDTEDLKSLFISQISYLIDDLSTSIP